MYVKVYDTVKMTCEHRYNEKYFRHTLLTMYAREEIEMPDLEQALKTGELVLKTGAITNIYKQVCE